MPKISSNLDIKDVNYNQKFWKKAKPLFPEKVTANETITLVDNSNIISSDIEIAKKLNTFLVMQSKNFKIKEDLLCDV